MSVYELDGYTLTLDKVERWLHDEDAHVRLADEAREHCAHSRAQVERWLEKDAPAVYGVNTGLGALKDVAVPAQDHIKWNKKLPYPHAAGFDEYLPAKITRLSLLLRANVLARGFSAVRPELIDRLLDLVNAGVAPAVRGHGSTGLSDLGPMAQCIMVVSGLPDSKAFYKGQLMSGPEALTAAGLADHFTLECKEVLAEMNGSTMTQAIAVLAYLHFQSIFGKCVTYLPAVRARAAEETVAWVGEILERENNITCDNPLLFKTEGDNYQAVMGCNCSNTQVGYAMDLLNIVIAQLGQALPDGAGSVIYRQRLATLAMQVSADSIPTKGGQEDHVEFSYTAAEKSAEAVAVLEGLLKSGPAA